MGQKYRRLYDDLDLMVKAFKDETLELPGQGATGRWTLSPTPAGVHRGSSCGYHRRMRVGGLLVDLDGTLYVGDEPVEGAREALDELKASGLVIRYVTNTTRKPRRAVKEHLLSLGFQVEEAEIFTPARAAAGLIGDRSCFALVDESLLEDLREITLTEDNPNHVLVGDLGEGFTYGRLSTAFRCLMGGAELIALQKNRYWRREDGLALDAGPFVAALEYASGKSATVVGKPEKGFFQLALEDLGLGSQEVAMVGDDAEADVAGAQAAGLRGIQVRTGKYRPETEGEPDLLLDSIAALPEALGV
jgi:HAD superfamily hydrolase (TIGR01458 family)